MSDEFIAKSFVALPHRCLTDKKFRRRHFKVLGAICRPMDAKTGQARIGQRRIAEIAGMARRKAREAIDELEAMGYIRDVSEVRHNSRGRFACTVYEIIFESEAEIHLGTEKVPRSRAPRECHGAGTEKVPIPKPINKTFSIDTNTDAAPSEESPRQTEPPEPTALQEGEGGEIAREPHQPSFLLPINNKKREAAERAWYDAMINSKDGEKIFSVLPSDITKAATAAELRARGDGLKVVHKWWAEDAKKELAA